MIKDEILSSGDMISYEDSKLNAGGISLKAARFLFEGSVSPEGKLIVQTNKHIDDLAIQYQVCKLITYLK